MALEFPIGRAVDAAGGALFILLGLWVLTLRPRRGGNVLLGAFLVLFGAYFVVDNVAVGLQVRPSFFPLLALLGILAGLGMLAVAAAVPRPLPPRDWWIVGVPALLATLPLVVRRVVVASQFGTLAAYASGMGWALLVGSLFAAGFAWGIRYRRAEARPERLQCALLAAAALLYAVFRMMDDPLVVARNPAAFPGSDTVAGLVRFVAFDALVVLAVFALWAWNAATRPDGALARNVALAVLAAGLAGLANNVAVNDAAVDVGGYGMIRAVAVVLLTVAILRGQLLDVDVKLRWGIHRGTVAAVFLVAFFAVSETAQAFFAGRAGSEYLGILAAGALVFALAPLQRAAERIADAAVPAAAAAGRPPLDAYRAALRMALADGAIGREEERELARLQRDLGLDPLEALEAREEAEAARRAP